MMKQPTGKWECPVPSGQACLGFLEASEATPMMNGKGVIEWAEPGSNRRTARAVAEREDGLAGEFLTDFACDQM